LKSDFVRSITPIPPNCIYNSKIILSIVISFVQIFNRHLNICTPPKIRENQFFRSGTGVTVTLVPPSAYNGPIDSGLVQTIVISFVQIYNRHLNICTPPKTRENQFFRGGTGVTVTPVPLSAYIGPIDYKLHDTFNTYTNKKNIL
jgi:hypothetical protein